MVGVSRTIETVVFAEDETSENNKSGDNKISTNSTRKRKLNVDSKYASRPLYLASGYINN
jgi:hypothetical protein